MVSVSELK